MVGADGEVGRRRPRLDLLVRAMGEDPVRETLDVSGEDWESILSGGMELDDRLLARLETMIGAMGQAVEWWDEVEDEEDDGEGASEDVGGVELDEGSERPSEEVPAEALSSRSWNWGEHLEERRASLRAMHHLAMVTQYQLGVRYQGQLAMMGLVAKIELALIFMGETLPDPGVDWDGDRRLRGDKPAGIAVVVGEAGAGPGVWGSSWSIQLAEWPDAFEFEGVGEADAGGGGRHHGGDAGGDGWEDGDDFPGGGG